MLKELICHVGGKFDKTVFCAPEQWVRCGSGTGVGAAYLEAYNKGYNFWGVLWQINRPRGEVDSPEFNRRVSLRVESPRHEVNQPLNDLKSKVIHTILRSKFRLLAREHGFGYEVGTLVSDAGIREHKSTTVFQITLDGNQVSSTSRDTIALVHAAIGTSVDMVLQPYLEVLRDHFSM